MAKKDITKSRVLYLLASLFMFFAVTGYVAGKGKLLSEKYIVLLFCLTLLSAALYFIYFIFRIRNLKKLRTYVLYGGYKVLNRRDLKMGAVFLILLVIFFILLCIMSLSDFGHRPFLYFMQ